MSYRYTFIVDIAELAGLSEKEAYDKGLRTGCGMEFETAAEIEEARSEVVAYGLKIHEKWEKSRDYIYVLAHEYTRGLTHGLQKKADEMVVKA
jgi:hypothetical protein